MFSQQKQFFESKRVQRLSTHTHTHTCFESKQLSWRFENSVSEIETWCKHEIRRLINKSSETRVKTTTTKKKKPKQYKEVQKRKTIGGREVKVWHSAVGVLLKTVFIMYNNTDTTTTTTTTTAQTCVSTKNFSNTSAAEQLWKLFYGLCKRRWLCSFKLILYSPTIFSSWRMMNCIELICSADLVSRHVVLLQRVGTGAAQWPGG